MSQHPLTSVIIPCFNSEYYLRDAIDCVLNQTYPRKELIVVDDGSTDGSPAIMAAYGEKITVIRQSNKGLPAARNCGISHSNGVLLAFLDADDYWENDFLEKMAATLFRSGAGIAYCGWQNVGLTGGRGMPFVPRDLEHEPNKLEHLVESPQWPVHAAVIRREIIEEVGGFEESWQSCEDFALWIEIATRHQLVRVPEVLAYYRHHDQGQMTGKEIINAQCHLLVQKQFLKRHPGVYRKIGRRRAREITLGVLLRRAYSCYWRRDLESAMTLFKIVMQHGYGRCCDWKYMLPSLLPMRVHRTLIALLGKNTEYSK